MWSVGTHDVESSGLTLRFLGVTLESDWGTLGAVGIDGALGKALGSLPSTHAGPPPMKGGYLTVLIDPAVVRVGAPPSSDPGAVRRCAHRSTESSRSVLPMEKTCAHTANCSPSM